MTGVKILFARFLTFLIRLYGQYAPWYHGRRLILRIARLLKFLDVDFTYRTRDGRYFEVNIEDSLYDTLLLYGEYEPRESFVLRKLILPRMRVFDIGANFGWYTTLFSRLVGDSGVVYAIEPVPAIYAKLQENCRRNGIVENVTLLNVAIGEKEGLTELHVFKGLPGSHSSISTLGRADYTKYVCPMITLDWYAMKNQLISKIDFIKCDVEGAEFSVIKGASKLMESEDSPIWLLELNNQTSAAFGFKPKDLLGYLESNFEYSRRFKIGGDHRCARLLEMASIEDYQHGDNVFCLKEYHVEKFLHRMSGLF